jgi:hypothetical protein
VIAGLIGFATVAVVFAVVNVAAGRSPFYTAALLGNALRDGGIDPATVGVTLGSVVTYSALHLVVFIAFGALAASLATLADRGWQLWFIALFFFIFVGFHLFGAIQAFAAPVRTALSDGMIWGAGIAASFMMAAYLIRAHPALRSPQSW